MENVWSSKRGTSLVEILVVMVVLLVGIMTVIQMFPTGFSVVKAAESRTVAAKLAEREIERWKNMPANLPTGILPIDDAGSPLNDQFPGPPFEAFQKDSNGDWIKDANDHFVRGNVLNIRQVFGETTSIPMGSYFQTGGGTVYGSRYTLAFSPIDVYEVGGGLEGLEVKSGDLKRRKGNRDFGYPPYLKAGQYAIDPGEEGTPAFYVAFPNNARDKSYYISYSYWITNGTDLELCSVLNDPVAVDPDYGGDWISVTISGWPSGYEFVEFDPDSDSCARKFVPLTASASPDWDPNDPYEYVLADSILGVIAFNPTGHGKYEHTAQGVQPIVARIDYRIYDPRIIREDKVIPQVADGATEIPVKLSLRFILDAGEPGNYTDGDITDNPDEPTFEGLMRKATVGGADRPILGKIGKTADDFYVDRSMLIIDLATGLRVDMSNVDIDYDAGVVHLSSNANLVDWNAEVQEPDVALSGRHLRFFYRADGDWSIQCQKAYAVYTRDWRLGNKQPDYNDYKLVNVPGSGGTAHKRLSFAACEAGKTVAVDYTYRSPDGVEHKVVGESHQISDAPSSANRYFCDLKVPDDCEVARIYAVVGTSFKVRVIWRDAAHWRYVDMDTNLTRGSSQQ